MIEYGIKPEDGGQVRLYAARRFAESHAAKDQPGTVVYRKDGGEWRDVAELDEAAPGGPRPA